MSLGKCCHDVFFGFHELVADKKVREPIELMKSKFYKLLVLD